MTDLEIIKRVRGGNLVAYEELVLKYEKKIYSAVMSMIKHEQDSMDLTQNVFLKAYLRIGNFNAESSYYTYLFKIAVNECKDYWRKNAKKKTASLTDEEGNPLEIKDTASDPQVRYESTELTMAVNAEIDKLPDEFREALLLRFVYGLTYDEIALQTNADIGTVKSRIHRGRQKVKEALISGNLI